MIRTLIAALALGLSASASHAVVVNEGDVGVPLVPVTDPVGAGIGGTVIYDVLVPFASSDGPTDSAVSGNVQSRVVRQNGTGNYVFGYRIRDLVFTTIPGGNDNSIQFFSLSGFAGFIPANVSAIGSAQSAGDTPFPEVSQVYANGFDFNIFLTTAEGSTFTYIETNTKFFKTGMFASIGANPGGNFQSTTLDGIAVPSLAPIPLPAGAVLLLSGLGLLALRRKA